MSRTIRVDGDVGFPGTISQLPGRHEFDLDASCRFRRMKLETALERSCPTTQDTAAMFFHFTMLPFSTF